MESVSALLALWRLAVPSGCPSLALLPRGQHGEHRLSLSAQAQACASSPRAGLHCVLGIDVSNGLLTLGEMREECWPFSAQSSQ